jgi:uncharacterized protein YbjT (DUF2867 family)
MTTVLVTGGTGNLGGLVVAHLLTAGATVRLASRRTRPEDTAAELEWHTVDYGSRAGLDRALSGVDVVLHCAGGSGRAEAGTMAALLSSGRRAGLPHLAYISIVGVDRIPLGYYRSKLAAERALIASGIPWTILRATQFHDLALSVTAKLCSLPVAVVPRLHCQPVAVAEVAARLVDIAAGPARGRVPEFGGPEILAFRELAQLYLRSQRKRKPMAPLPLAGRVARALRAGAGLTPDHGDGLQTFAQFLALRDVAG